MGKTLETMTDIELVREIVRGEVRAQLAEKAAAEDEAKAKAEQDPFAKHMEKYGKSGKRG